MRFTIQDNGKTSTIDAKNEAEARRLYRQAEYPTKRALPSNVLVYPELENITTPVGRVSFPHLARPAKRYNSPGISPGHRAHMMRTSAAITYIPPGISTIGNDLVVDTESDPDNVVVRRRLGFAKWEAWKQPKPKPDYPIIRKNEIKQELATK